jgi:hypothetical protein
MLKTQPPILRVLRIGRILMRGILILPYRFGYLIDDINLLRVLMGPREKLVDYRDAKRIISRVKPT